MSFKPFDIDMAIARSNEEHGTTYRRAEFGFLQALSTESLSALSCANELLSRAVDFGLIDENATDLLDRVKAQLIDNDLKAVRATVQNIKIQLEKKALHDWHVEQQRRLTNPDLWQQLLAHPSAKLFSTPLGKLQHQWLQSPHGRYAAHTSSAILFIIRQIIPMLENYYDFAKTELNFLRFRLPRFIRAAYQQHLDQAHQQLVTLKQDLGDTMLVRLEMASQSGILSYDDNILHTSEWLAKQQLIKQQYGLPAQKYYGIDNPTFNEFVSFVHTQGNQAQQRKLHSLPSFIVDEDFAIQHFNHGMLIIPSQLDIQHLIPKKPVYFPKLFPQHHARFQFMQKNLWLFANLRVLAQFNLQKHTLSISTQHLLDLEDTLEAAHLELGSSTLTGWQKIFSPSTTRFKLLWKNYYDIAQRQLLDKKIELLEFLDTNIRQGISFALEKDNVEKLCASIKPETGLNTLTQEKMERYVLIKKKLLKQIRPPIDNNPFSDPINPEPPIIKLLEPEQQRIQFNDLKLLDFFNNIQLFKLDESNFEESLTSIKNTAATIAESNSEANKAKLSQLYAKIFEQYLRFCISFKTADDLLAVTHKLQSSEELLLSSAPDYIQERINTLREIRTTNEWFMLFSIKCRSYLASCLQQTTPYVISNASIFNLKSPALQTAASSTTPQLIGAQ